MQLTVAIVAARKVIAEASPDDHLFIFVRLQQAEHSFHPWLCARNAFRSFLRHPSARYLPQPEQLDDGKFRRLLPAVLFAQQLLKFFYGRRLIALYNRRCSGESSKGMRL
jgi:hypothetical protein